MINQSLLVCMRAFVSANETKRSRAVSIKAPKLTFLFYSIKERLEFSFEIDNKCKFKTWKWQQLFLKTENGPNMPPCTSVFTHGGENNIFLHYSASVSSQRYDSISSELFRHTSRPSKGIRLSYSHAHTHTPSSWLTVKLLTEQSEAETETKTVQLWKELWL